MPRRKIGKQRSYRISDLDYEEFRKWSKGKIDVSGAVRIALKLLESQADLLKLLENQSLKMEAVELLKKKIKRER
jgi:hypothetical protein